MNAAQIFALQTFLNRWEFEKDEKYFEPSASGCECFSFECSEKDSSGGTPTFFIFVGDMVAYLNGVVYKETGEIKGELIQVDNIKDLFSAFGQSVLNYQTTIDG